MKTLAVVTQKGGPGKTTTTMNTGAALAKQGKKVLLIDLDPQRNLSDTLGYVQSNQPTTINELIYFSAYDMPCDYRQFVRHNEAEGLDFIPATRALNTAPTLLATAKNGSTVLAKILQQEFFKQYDFVLLDCRAALDLLTTNALAASNGVIIPVEPEEYAVNGLADVMETIATNRSQFNPALEITGVLITKADSRRNSVATVRADLEEVLGDKVFQTTIPYLNEAPIAAAEHRSCVNMKNSRIGACYMEVAREVLKWA
jgi:ATPases involved in chromosome partitioning